MGIHLNIKLLWVGYLGLLATTILSQSATAADQVVISAVPRTGGSVGWPEFPSRPNLYPVLGKGMWSKGGRRDSASSTECRWKKKA